MWRNTIKRMNESLNKAQQTVELREMVKREAEDQMIVPKLHDFLAEIKAKNGNSAVPTIQKEIRQQRAKQDVLSTVEVPTSDTLSIDAIAQLMGEYSQK